MARPICVYIDCEAAQHNLMRVREMAPGCSLMAVVKANAYGHGIERLATCFQDADAFAVASVEEAIALRNLGVQHPIVLLEGVFHAHELAAVKDLCLQMVVHCHEQVDMLRDACQASCFEVWLKVDTGMHRLGFSPEEAVGVWHDLAQMACVAQPPGLMTHFASADVVDSPANMRQMALFEQVAQALPKTVRRSLANSAAIVHYPASHGDWVRPGVMLYGVSPSVVSTASLGLKPVMTMVTRVISVKTVKVGESVGYGGIWTAGRDSHIAIIAIGYGDGYPRHVPSGTPVLINGSKAPIVGRVSMDMICVDVSDLPPVDVGDPVVLWGKGLPIEQLAEAANTISYELLCGVTKRVPGVLASVPDSWFHKPQQRHIR